MYTLRIEQLHCMSCFHNIEDALKDLDPTIKAHVNLKQQQVEVETSRHLEEVKKALQAVGYEVEVVT